MARIERSVVIFAVASAFITALGCDEHTELGGNCGHETEPTDDVVIVYSSGGGMFARSARYLVSADGIVTIENSQYGDHCEAELEVIGTTVDELMADLDDTGVYHKDDGCYDPKNIVEDGVSSSLLIRDGSGLRFFSSSDGAGPGDVLDALAVVGLAMLNVEASCGDVFHPLDTEYWCELGTVELSPEQSVVFDVIDRRTDLREGYSILADGTVYNGEFTAFSNDLQHHCVGNLEAGEESVQRLLNDLAETNAHTVEQGCYSPRESIYGELMELTYVHEGEVINQSTYADAGPQELTEAMEVLAEVVENIEFSCD